MKLSSLIFAVIVFLCANAYSIADEVPTKYNLSTPDATVQSFFDAVNNGDMVELENILGPRIKKMITEGKFTTKKYAEAWSSYPVVKISKAELVNFKNDPRELASVDIVILVEGKEHKSHISLIKIDGQWLWNEK